MANVLQIKRSAVTASPVSLAAGELAYSEVSGNLFIGTANGAALEIIGGAAAMAKLAGIAPGATPDMTPTAILAALSTVDGTGSGLDADLLGGKAANLYAALSDLAGYVANTQLGAPGGVATLDASGTIPTSQIPALAIGTPHVVATEAAMLALAAQTGDVAIRTDLGKSFMLSSTNPTVLADWIEISANGSVSSVNGQTGLVVLGAADVGADSAGSAQTVQNNLVAHEAANDPHGTAALLVTYLQDTDIIDGGSF